MATPNYEQIQSFGYVTGQLREAAVNEFLDSIDEFMSRDEIIEQAVRVAEKYALLGSELGAQWYDLCSELAGLDVDPAELSETDGEEIASRAYSYVDSLEESEPLERAFNEFLQNEINNSIRKTGNDNLWRDYERGTAGGKWARVPVGPTCGWCLMLASQGAWYLTKESALGESSGHYHRGCNCIAVYHADAESISGYTELERYKSMYYECENTRIAHENGLERYPDDLQKRIIEGKDRHEKLEEKKKLEATERGEDYEEKPWTVYNEDLIIMRYKYGVK